MRILPFVSVAALVLVGAAPHTYYNAKRNIRIVNGYPPCSRSVTDSCIQLYERGVATAANLALNEKLGPGRTFAGWGGPSAPVRGSSSAEELGPVPPEAGTRSLWDSPATPRSYPPCSATITDRCQQKPIASRQIDGWEPNLDERG